jgi:hypothetical protein
VAAKVALERLFSEHFISQANSCFTNWATLINHRIIDAL